MTVKFGVPASTGVTSPTSQYLFSDETTSDGGGTSGSGLTGGDDVDASVVDPEGETPELDGPTGAVVAVSGPLLPEGPTAPLPGVVGVGFTVLAVGPTAGATEPVVPTGAVVLVVGETAPLIPVPDVCAEEVVDEPVPEGSVLLWSDAWLSGVEQARTKHPNQKLLAEGRSFFMFTFERSRVASRDYSRKCNGGGQ